MKRLSNKIGLLIIIMLFAAIVGAFLFIHKHYIFAVFCWLILIYTSHRLYKLNMRIVNHFKLFVDSIKFSESNISFSNNISDEIYSDYYNSLVQTLEKINLQSQKRETDISFYNNLLNKIDFALIVVDRECKIVWINKVALNILGRPKHNMENLPEEFKQIFESLQPKSSKILKLEMNGKVKNLIANLSTITIRGDKLNIYSLKDVQSVVDETEDTAWEQLIKVLTHEIMNSLTPIISLSENLSDKASDVELLSKAMGIIHRRSKGLVSFVNNYKKLTQIPMPTCTRVKVKSLIEDVANLMQDQGVELQIIIATRDLTLHIDRGQMEQVLINLIKNARDACFETINPIIKIAVLSDEFGHVIINIVDNGSGMESSVLEKIFTPFYTTKPHGSGIGLSICRQIVVLHGGVLTAASVLGEGSIFTIRM